MQKELDELAVVLRDCLKQMQKLYRLHRGLNAELEVRSHLMNKPFRYRMERHIEVIKALRREIHEFVFDYLDESRAFLEPHLGLLMKQLDDRRLEWEQLDTAPGPT